MEYRTNRRTGDRISVIGLGTSTICEADEAEAVATLEEAYERGVDYFDLATSDAVTFGRMREALGSVRDKVLYQVHFGADYTHGEYGWSTDAETIKRSLDLQLTALRTDYIDYAFIHCIDEQSDWDAYRKGGALDLLLRMKEQGVARHIGLSSHVPALVETVLDTGLPDMVMFSINPGYDYSHGEFANGSAAERMALYRRCEAEGVGISVMKPYSGGQLLDARTSPFGKALTEYRCISYALDKPGVLTVLPGVRDREQLRRTLGWLEASAAERDYSVIGTFAPADARGKCVYCNHCKPCPVGLDIGTINKYYDLARVGDAQAADHYMHLARHASDCVACGHCDRRCPFKVRQSERMKEIAAYFGV